MQRIKLDVFHSLFEKELTGNEIDFIIALTHLAEWAWGSLWGALQRNVRENGYFCAGIL